MFMFDLSYEPAFCHLSGTAGNSEKKLTSAVLTPKTDGTHKVTYLGDEEIVLVDAKGRVVSEKTGDAALTSGGKTGNVGSLKLNQNTVSLKAGKSFTLKVEEVKKDKKIGRHRKAAFESGNTRIATVTSKGKIKAKKPGTCYIYVYAQNGIYKKVKVTVKKK